MPKTHQMVRLPYNPRARDAASLLLDLYGMLVVYCEQTDIGDLTCLFGGYDTGFDFIYSRNGTRQEWERQAKWLSEKKRVEAPKWDDGLEENYWVLLRLDLHSHSPEELR